MNIREETIASSYYVISLFYYIICLSLITLSFSFTYFPRYYENMLYENTPHCKILIVPEEGWFSQPQYSTSWKNIWRMFKDGTGRRGTGRGEVGGGGEKSDWNEYSEWPSARAPFKKTHYAIYTHEPLYPTHILIG